MHKPYDKKNLNSQFCYQILSNVIADYDNVNMGIVTYLC